MDSANYRFLMDLAKNQGQKNKISRLMDLVSPMRLLMSLILIMEAIKVLPMFLK